MNYFLFAGKPLEYIPPANAKRFETEQAAKDAIGNAECGLIVPTEHEALDETYPYPFEAMLYYTQECGWYSHAEMLEAYQLSVLGAWGCGKIFTLIGRN